MTNRIVIVFALLINLVRLAPFEEDLIVTLADGKVQGAAYVNDNNKTYFGFRGIPYATPPVGDLRFEHPQPSKPWSGVWNATTDSKFCISANYSNQPELESEDCLYINVYVPTLKFEKKIPVMAWIHGGAFIEGSSAKFSYGPDYLIEEDIIVVSFNYRVGPFGFLSTGDKVLPGNLGLKDQNLALKWIRQNIEYFGGDRDKVTIFGQSAGGASTGLHLVSKLSAGLFGAAIVESGSALNDWAVDQDPKKKAYAIADAIPGGNYDNGTQALKDFLKNQTVEEIMKAAIHLWPTIEVESDTAFLTEAPYKLLESGDFNKVPIIIGICTAEALMFLVDFNNTQKSATLFDTVQTNAIPEDLYPNSTDQAEVIEKVRNIYLLENETFSSDLVQFVNYYTDNMFVRGVIRHAELTSKYVPVHFYQFAYFGRTHLIPFIDGAEKASHSAELPFIFERRGLTSSDPEDVLIQNRMVKLWTNFAKYLDPTPEETELLENLKWPLFDNKTFSYVNINKTLEVRQNVRGNSYPEWVNIYETYGRKPFITF